MQDQRPNDLLNIPDLDQGRDLYSLYLADVIAEPAFGIGIPGKKTLNVSANSFCFIVVDRDFFRWRDNGSLLELMQVGMG